MMLDRFVWMNGSIFFKHDFNFMGFTKGKVKENCSICWGLPTLIFFRTCLIHHCVPRDTSLGGYLYQNKTTTFLLLIQRCLPGKTQKKVVFLVVGPPPVLIRKKTKKWGGVPTTKNLIFCVSPNFG